MAKKMFIKKLDLFILKNYLMLFAGTFCISLFVVMMQFLWKYIDDLVGKGLSYSVLAQFFFYAAETLVPLALPLAILLASLISFGNLGERLELLAIKAAGISLFRALMPLIVLNAGLAFGSFYFQNNVTPHAESKLTQLMISMRQKSPELDIPEGVFYDGIQNINLYVKKKNKETGMLYDVIIYNMSDGVYQSHIILADSGRLETSADKMHLTLYLYNGEQFENLQNSRMMMTNNVPYRRETFVRKHFLIDFDTNFKMVDSESMLGSARTKNIAQLSHDIDSMEVYYDSLGHAYADEMCRSTLYVPMDTTKKAAAKAGAETVELDSLFNRLDPHQRQRVILAASQRVSMQKMTVDYNASMMDAGDHEIRMHWIKTWEKITMSLACLMFFFIGAPLGAIIRKGGLGLPVVVAVIIFIVYYIINTLGTKTCRQGSIPVWFGMWLSTMVLAPLGVYFTVKSNNDSTVFNMDTYRNFFRKLWGIRTKRHIVRKEVIINDPDYPQMAELLGELSKKCREYMRNDRRHTPFGYLKFIFSKRKDEEAEEINTWLEYAVDSLCNSKDKYILKDLNFLPVMDTGDFRFYRRRRGDMKAIIKYSEKIKEYIDGKYQV